MRERLGGRGSERRTRGGPQQPGMENGEKTSKLGKRPGKYQACQIRGSLKSARQKVWCTLFLGALLPPPKLAPCSCLGSPITTFHAAAFAYAGVAEHGRAGRVSIGRDTPCRKITDAKYLTYLCGNKYLSLELEQRRS